MTSTQTGGGNGQINSSRGPSASDTSPIRSLVNRTRRLLRSTWVMTGLLASFGLGLLLVVLMTMTDFLVSSVAPSQWTVLRALALVLLVVPTAWAVISGVLRPLFRRLSSVLVARRIELELPQIHNRLVTCIDLEDENRSVPVSEAFHRKLVGEALERIRGFNPRKVLDLQSLQRAGLMATVGLVALSVIFVPGVSTAMNRVFNPFADIPPDGHVAYEVHVGNQDQLKPGNGDVVRGDDVVFQIRLTDDRSLYEDERLSLVIDMVNDEGEPVTMRHTLPRFQPRGGERTARLTLKGLEHQFRYRVHGGGTYTPEYTVQMLARPEIVNVSSRLAYPEYMEKLDRTTLVADVEGPVGSTVNVLVVAEGDISAGDIEFLELKRVVQAVSDRAPRSWFTSVRPEGSAPSGTWQTEMLAGAEAHTDPPNTAVHSHGFTKAKEAFQVGTDEVLFVDVYLPPDQQPREIMLKWHDGQGWEHRAFWGEDLINEGKRGTVSRVRIGDLPPTGQVVRLEVPANVVGLAGRSITGMMFTLYGGQAVWGASGAMRPSEEAIVKLLPTGQTEPLKLIEPGDAGFPEERATGPRKLKDGQVLYTGAFPLLEDGLYRVRLKNDADRYNKTMAEAKFVAITDTPPQVIIERPRQTLVLTKPQPVPVAITSFDDFGVKHVVLSTKTNDDGAFEGEPVVTLSPPVENDHREIILDLEDRGLKIGDTLTYRIEVRDGKGLSGQTIDYSIQIKNDNSAADKQFEQLEKKTETFRDKLVDLIAKQKKIQQTTEKLENEFKELTEKIEKAKEEQAKQEETKPDDAKKKEDPKAQKPEEKPVELTPEEQKKLNALKAELNKLAAEENKNVQLSEQVKNDLGALAKQAEENPLVPPQVADQMKKLENAFEKAAVDPLKKLAEEIKKAAEPKQQDTKLPEVNKKAERVQKDLETIQKRMDALARAQRDSREDPKQAMQELKKDLLEQNAELARDALQELKDYLAKLQKDLAQQQDKEQNLLKDSMQELTTDALRDALKLQQEETAEKSNKDLKKAKDVLGDPPKAQNKNAQKDNKNQDAKAKKDLADPLMPPDGKQSPQDPKGDNKPQDGEPEPKAQNKEGLPDLEGLKADVDPKFEKLLKDLQAKMKKRQDEGKEAGDPDQLKRLEDLNQAQQALKNSNKSLKTLQDQIKKAQDKSAKSQDEPTPQQQKALDEIAKTLQQPLMERARAMMRRMQQQQAKKAQQQDPQQADQQPMDQQKNDEPMPPMNPLANALIANQKPDGEGTETVLVDLDKLDVETRRVILKMQPKEREELLQGLREEGPKAYQGFIRDYFKKLSRARSKGPQK